MFPLNIGLRIISFFTPDLSPGCGEAMLVPNIGKTALRELSSRSSLPGLAVSAAAVVVHTSFFFRCQVCVAI